MVDTTTKPPAISTSTQQFILAILVVLMAGGMLTLLFFINIPKDNEQLLTLALGIVLGVLGTIASFYWPSSVGSKAKDDAINALASQVASAPPTTTTTTTTVKKDAEDPLSTKDSQK